MTQVQFLNDWIQDAVFVGFLATVLFPFTGIYFPWWRHAFGWNMVLFDLALSIALLPAFLHRVFGLQVTGFAYMYIVVAALTAIPCIVTWRAWVLYRVQRAGAQRAREERAARNAMNEEHRDSQREAQ